MDNEIYGKIDVTAIQFLLVQNRQQTHDRTLIGSGANGLGIQEWPRFKLLFIDIVTPTVYQHLVLNNDFNLEF